MSIYVYLKRLTQGYPVLQLILKDIYCILVAPKIKNILQTIISLFYLKEPEGIREFYCDVQWYVDMKQFTDFFE